MLPGLRLRGTATHLGYLVGLIFLLATLPSAAATPETTATAFVQHLQRGDLNAAKRLLEDPGYRYRPPGGDDVYFNYESGYDPNLAFLVGHPYVIGTPSGRQQRSDWYLLDGTIYATLAVPLRFETYRPWVLPAPTAFGRPIDFSSFMNFVIAPAANPELLSLRIRPSLEPGLIQPPKPRFVAPPPPVNLGARAVVPQASGSDTYSALTGSRPVDPAPVVLPSGERLTPAQMGRLLPRLGGMTLNLSLIRWGRLSSWRIVRWELSDAILLTENGEVTMRTGKGLPSERQ
jgi:hypothetical protein